MSSRIEQIIEEIEEYVESCKYQPLSTTKIIVNKEEIEELLRELRLKTPDEIKRYQKIISNKDAILQDAQSKADNIIEDTKKQVKEMVKESEVMQQAYAQANETINSANQQAQAIVDAAFVLNGLKEVALAGMVKVPKRDMAGNQEVDSDGNPAWRMIDAPSATGALKTLAQCIGLGKDKDEKDQAITTLAETLSTLVNKQ